MLININEKEINIEKEQNIIKMEDSITMIVSLNSDKTRIETTRSALVSILSNIEYHLKEVNAAKQRLQSLNKKLKDNYPDICPLCGSKTKKQ